MQECYPQQRGPCAPAAHSHGSMQGSAAQAEAQHQANMVAELDRYADLQRAMAAAKDAFDAERASLLAEKQGALDAQARDYHGQLAVSLARAVLRHTACVFLGGCLEPGANSRTAQSAQAGWLASGRLLICQSAMGANRVV